MFWIGGFGENFLVSRITLIADLRSEWLPRGIQQGSVSMEDGSTKNDPCSARLGYTAEIFRAVLWSWLLLVAIEWLQLLSWHRATELPPG